MKNHFFDKMYEKNITNECENYFVNKINKIKKKITNIKKEKKKEYLQNMYQKMYQKLEETHIINQQKYTNKTYSDINNPINTKLDDAMAMIKKMSDEKRHDWFGFKVNNNLANLFFLGNIPLDILNYNDSDDLSHKQKNTF